MLNIIVRNIFGGKLSVAQREWNIEGSVVIIDKSFQENVML